MSDSQCHGMLLQKDDPSKLVLRQRLGRNKYV